MEKISSLMLVGLMLLGNVSFAEGHFEWTRSFWKGTENMWKYGTIDGWTKGDPLAQENPFLFGMQDTKYALIAFHDTVGEILQGGYTTEEGEYLSKVKENLVYFVKKLVNNPVPHVKHT